MNKLYNNGKLTVDTSVIAQRSGGRKIAIDIEDYSSEYNYYVEFESASKCKAMSDKVVASSGGGYSITVPAVVSHVSGEVYMQIALYDKISGEIVARSLVSDNPIYDVNKSILASESIMGSEADDYVARLEMMIADSESKMLSMSARIDTFIAENESKVATINSQLVAVNDALSLSVNTINGKIKLVNQVIFDINTNKVVNGVSYANVLPASININLNTYKTIRFYYKYFENQIVLEGRKENLYLGKFRTAIQFAAINNKDEYNIITEYTVATQLLTYKLYRRVLTNGVYVYTDISSAGIDASNGITRIEGCIS